MNFNDIVPYLDPADKEESLKEFFGREDIKSFLSEKWKEYTDTEVTLPKDTDEQPLSVQPEEIQTVTNPETPVDMPFIPSIPDDEETKARYQSLFSETRHEMFSRKLKGTHIQFQNGKVNQPYQMLLDVIDLGMPEVGRLEFIGLNEIGLNFNPETCLVEGIPTTSGDFKIKLQCYLQDWKEGDPVFEKLVTLIINPDPRALWNSIPTPEDIPYYKPDSDCKYVKIERTKGFLGMGAENRKDMVAASQRGRSHAHEGKPRDDDFSIIHNDNTQWYTAIVADGAGSAEYSRKGSEIACRTVSEVCDTHLTKYSKEIDELIKDFDRDNSDSKRKKLGDALYNILGSAVFKAYKNIEQEAIGNNAQLKDYSTTLLVALTKKYKFGWFVATFWVGDGGIGIYNKETGYLKIMGEPDGGDFAGQTRFLTMGEVMQPTEIYKRLRFEIVEDFTALVLMTDGVTDPKFETDSNLQKPEKWDALWKDITSKVELTDDNEASAQQLLKWLDFWSPGNHDDRTIAIIY